MSGRILVTGGAGFVGSHLVRALRRRGRDVVVYDPASELPVITLDSHAYFGDLIHLRSDVTDPGQLVEALNCYGVTDVIHVAALLADRESLMKPRLFLRVNAEAVWQLCDIARHFSSIRRIVTVSTRAVYGSYEPDEGPLGEDALPKPSGFYGGAKAAADLGVSLYRHNFGLDAVAARITGVYGPGQNYRGMLDDMIRSAVDRVPYIRDVGADYPYEFNYVKDVVRGLLALLDAETLQFPIYNVGSGELHTYGHVASIIRKVIPGARVELGAGSPEGAAPRAALAVDRVERDANFKSRWSLEEGIGDTVTYLRGRGYGDEID